MKELDIGNPEKIKNYKLIVYKAYTEDGYILTLHRLINSEKPNVVTNADIDKFDSRKAILL